MKRIALGSAAVLLAAACLVPNARAAVTLTEENVALNPATPEVTTPCWVFQNDLLQIAVVKSTGRIPAIIKRTGAAAGTNQAVVAYPAFLDWAQQKGPAAASLVLTANPDGDDSDAKRSLRITGTIDTTVGTTFGVSKTYRLRDQSKAFEAEMSFTNNGVSEWLPADPYNGACEVIYVAPGGSVSVADEMQVKLATGIDVPTATTWYGWAASGTPKGELLEGWLASVDQVNLCDVIVTWDKASQTAHSPAGLTATRAGKFSSRFQINPSFTKVAGGETFTYKQFLLVDDGVKTVSYAAPEAFIGGIALSTAMYPQGSTVNYTFQLNSTKAAASAAYELKNVQLVDSTGVLVKSLPDVPATTLNANQNISIARQFSLATDADISKTYMLKADVYPEGGSTAITTLFSKQFGITSADVKVQLYLDPSNGTYILENENIKAVINPAQGYVQELYVKSVSRNQAASGYTMFRDAITNPNRATFTGFTAVLDPNGTDSPTKKSIQFQNGYSALADLNKTFTLESLSKTLQVDLSMHNVSLDPITGWGFYSDVPSQVGGSGGAEDQLTVHAGGKLLYDFKVPTDPGYMRYWFGCTPQTDNTALLAGSQPELDQPWMAASDSNNGDALATTWDRATQVQYSPTPADGSSVVTMNCVFRGGENAVGEGRRHVMETHFANIPAGATVNYSLYTIADTGMKLVSFAEGKRVMAGLWSNAAEVGQGTALSFTLSVTNVGVTDRTFDVKNIRLVKDTAEIVTAAADQNAIALTAGANSTTPLTFTIPAAQALGVYHLEADLFEGATQAATLSSLPFSVITPPALPGDVNSDGKVDSADVALALSIAGGLTTATADNVTMGDLWPTTPDKTITMEDAVAIARKVGGL